MVVHVNDVRLLSVVMSLDWWLHGGNLYITVVCSHVVGLVAPWW